MNADTLTCPLCNSGEHMRVARHLYLCTSCYSVFNTGYRALSYGDTYFLDEYKNQYGKTYIEDHDNIRRVSEKRLSRIFRLMQGSGVPPGLSLLDIGSALGFFLKSAQDMGVAVVRGIEISSFACEYCTGTLGIDVVNMPFWEADVDGPFDIITAWFFIEHCPAPLEVIERIYNMLPEGGIFAFSAPSIFGPLFRFNQEDWIDTHPADHRVDFSPRGARKLLRRAGFRRVQVRPAGFHPERIMRPDSLLFRPFSFIYRLFSGMTAFSDTIEVYAIK